MRQRRILLLRVGSERRFVDVQHLAVGAVADRVDGELHAVLHGDPCRLLDVRHRRRVEAGATRRIRVRLEQPGAPRAESAVGGHLDGGDRQVLIGHADDLRLGQVLAQALVAVADHHPEADAEPGVARDLLVERHGVEIGAGVLEAGHAVRERFLRGQSDRATEVGGPLFRGPRRLPCVERLVDQSRGSLAKDPDWPAGGVLEDVTARRVGGLRGDARGLHRLRVREARVAAGMLQQHGVVRGRLAERVVIRKALDVRRRGRRPLLLVPAAPEDPVARPRGLRRVGDLGHDLREARGVHQVDHHLRLTEPEEVPVPFDEPWNRGLSREIDHLSRRPNQRRNLRVGADGGDAVAAHRQGLGPGLAFVHGDDVAATQYQ